MISSPSGAALMSSDAASGRTDTRCARDAERRAPQSTIILPRMKAPGALRSRRHHIESASYAAHTTCYTAASRLCVLRAAYAEGE